MQKRKRLSRNEVLKIPTLREEGKTDKQIAEKFGCSERTINKWVNVLRKDGFKVLSIPGPRPLKLKE